jgi:hypothetical protein
MDGLQLDVRMMDDGGGGWSWVEVKDDVYHGVQLLIEIDCNPSRGTDSITPDYDATERHCHEVVTYARETRCEHGPIVWIRVGGCCT